LANETDHDILIRIEEKIGNIKEDVTEIRKDVKAQNGRVRKLEIGKAKLWGGITVAAIIIPLLFKYIL
jgi:hypothetical protein